MSTVHIGLEVEKKCNLGWLHLSISKEHIYSNALLNVLALGMSYQIAVYKCFANGATVQKGAIYYKY